jgi:hypothetical protein
MRDIVQQTDQFKPTIDGSDAAELIRARRAQSPAQFKKLLTFHRARGVSDAEIVAAMAKSPHLINALGKGRRRP